jgi:formylglycine-generating enzyme required for sulfatase activity
MLKSAPSKSINAYMKTRPICEFLCALLLLLAVAGQPARPQEAPKPLSKFQIMELVQAGMRGAELAEWVKQHGIDFDLTDDFVQELRNAGAGEGVIQMLRAARPSSPKRDRVQAGAAMMAGLVVETSPAAEVFVDGVSQGHANAQGELAITAKPGDHTLKVSLAGKKEFVQSVTLATGPASRIEARLADTSGSIKLRTLTAARIALDGVGRGSTDANGELVLAGLAPGDHQLRVTAQGKKDFEQSVSVSAGQEIEIQPRLENAGPPPPGTVRGNPQDGLGYVWIPPGSFQMGCSPGDSECSADEKPPHQVILTRGFWLGRTEVTVGAYQKFVASKGVQMPAAPDFNAGWKNPDMPITNVSWDDAKAFCGWTGGRLPTEAEWEYAARAGSKEALYGPLDEVAWYATNSGARTHEVGQKRANAFGLYDVLGNVWEWVNDWYDDKYYQHSPSQDPAGPTSGQFHVLRGGSWALPQSLVRVSFRVGLSPASGNFSFGFRCVGEGTPY